MSTSCTLALLTKIPFIPLFFWDPCPPWGWMNSGVQIQYNIGKSERNWVHKSYCEGIAQTEMTLSKCIMICEHSRGHMLFLQGGFIESSCRTWRRKVLLLKSFFDLKSFLSRLLFWLYTWLLMRNFCVKNEKVKMWIIHEYLGLGIEWTQFWHPKDFINCCYFRRYLIFLLLAISNCVIN